MIRAEAQQLPGERGAKSARPKRQLVNPAARNRGESALAPSAPQAPAYSSGVEAASFSTVANEMKQPTPASSATAPAFLEQSAEYPMESCTESCATGCGERCEECDCVECCCCDDYWQHRSGIWGGFLYLHAGDVDMAHAIQQNGTGGAGTVPDGRVGVAAPEYEPAFNVGANWALSDCSSVWASYTHFESRTSDSLGAPSGVGGTVGSLVLHPGTVNAGSTSSFVNANYDIDFDMFDVNFSRLFSGSECHAINYHVGARYASLDQKFGQFGTFAPPTGDLSTTSFIDFEGVGPRIGVDGRARLGRGGFSLYGNTFLSFLLGEFQSTYRQFNLTTDTREAYSTWTDARMVPLLETELGLSWTNCTGCLRVSAGYQLMWWFNAITVGEHIQAVQNSNFLNVGDTIAFDGLTTRVEWRF
jgi:hypothetical protein